jgi:hypothetical protein
VPGARLSVRPTGSETVSRRLEGEMKNLLVLMTAVVSIPLVGNTRAEACLVKDPSGNLSVRSSPNGRIVGALKNGTLVVIEERRGDWVSITPHAKRSDTPVWVRYAQLDCDFIDDEYRKADCEVGKLEAAITDIRDDLISDLHDPQQAPERCEPRITPPYWFRCPACNFEWREWLRPSIIFVSLSFVTDTCPNCRRRHVSASRVGLN